MKQKTWIAVIVVGTLAINAMAYVVVRKRRASDVPPPPPVSATPTPPVTAPAPPSEDANEGLSRARRAAGLAALEDRDYDIAVREFTEALSLRRTPGGDLVELLRIATDLQSRERDRTRVEPARPAREPAVTRTPPRAKPSRSSPSRASPQHTKEEPPPVVEEPRNGLLLVTSTPPGLVVQVDGKAVDMTPARLPLRPGTYRVALAQGERRLMEETVVLEEDGVHSLNRDVSEQLAPPAPPRPVATTAPTEPQPTPPVAAAAPVAVKAEATGRGELDISSPSLYGEVWVNNRPYGFPPLVAQNLPAGPARVEVRVNGEVKRRMSVEVEAGRRVAVRVR
ncbi:PEGA domain-containing protein [Myxococcus sp. MISCRS1]|uniref:PEGA domain-containing protein n=1 Tax=Myxococcus TaxID=32 RepID=UPI001CBBCE82|nr:MULTISPECIES: PEGA domain-containing protein [unclassified Myxococcus]MBZ4396187.1 PEGA domain-containing protein [Myxococcus sp. AS-1-15]MCY1000760.1 PEGA domain-containing protein [Myxococcus sp. MISCRS1]BDT37693.1 PEGA domain-containing protein [Myxococcus sp. MH1]